MHLFLSLILAAAAAVPAAPAPKLERLAVETAKGERVFQVEVVREETERNRGLMFRRHLADDRGMLFDYDPPQPIDFWMKNTYISLDIIFIDAKGRIITIAEKTTPLSLDHIPSHGRVRGVLEVNGGLSAKLGIKVGDAVRYSWFDHAQ